MSSSKKLRRCPWCGEYPEVVAFEEWYGVVCSNLSCPVQPYQDKVYSLPSAAEEAWGYEDNGG